MPTMSFWNVGRLDRPELMIGALAAQHDADVILLAECDVRSADLVGAISDACGGESFSEVPPPESSSHRIRMISRDATGALEFMRGDDRVAVSEYRPTTGDPLIVAGVHLPSKLYSDPSDQAYWARRAVGNNHDVETQLGHMRTLVIGDFNMNPFEEGMIAIDAFNAVMEKGRARTPRERRGIIYHRFYNPMWSRLGDDNEGPPGTFFQQSGGSPAIYWHTLDQVLLRWDVLPPGGTVRVEVPDAVGGMPIDVVRSRPG